MAEVDPKELGAEGVDLVTYPMGGGKVMKVVSFGKAATPMTDAGSKQLAEDPFAYDVNGLKPPPYSLEQLVMLAESHPTHSASLEQKATDVVADGVQWTPIDENEEEPDAEQRTALEDWWQELADGYEMVEVLYSAALDFETLGWGFIEVTRKANGEVGHLYPIPAHTVRAHKDGVRFAQIRSGQTMWFKRWGVANEFLAETGEPTDPSTDRKLLANELLVFRRPARRSTWYGIPSYVSAIGHVSLAIAARDYNVLFFNNAREPRHIYIIEGLEEDILPSLAEIIEEMKQGLLDPHRNLVVPLTGGAKIRIESLHQKMNDAHFQKLSEAADQEILMAHRVPPDRIGHPTRGPLGGSAALVTNRIYKDGVVSKTQAVFEHRLNRFIQTEFPPIREKTREVKPGETGTFVVPRSKYKLGWKADLEELDVSDEAADVTTAMALVDKDAITINEGRSRVNLKPLKKFRKDIEEYIRDLEAKEMGRERTREQLAHPPKDVPDKPAAVGAGEKPTAPPEKTTEPGTATPDDVKKATDLPPTPEEKDDVVSEAQQKRIHDMMKRAREACEADPTELDMTITEYRKHIGGGAAPGGGPPPPAAPPPGAPFGKATSFDEWWAAQNAVLRKLDDLDTLLEDVFLEDDPVEVLT